jgi:type III restriction enzyme
MSAGFQLRSYQQEALDVLGAYLRKVPTLGANTAFYDATKRPYAAAPFVDPATPYVCVRIPTGGGKTLVAAHAVGIAAREYLQADNPMVLWLVPTRAILDQTLGALKNLEHPYRLAMARDFGRNLSVLTVSEALSLSKPDATGGACVIVSTIQAFKVEDTSNRKVYEDSGTLMDHFSGLAAEQLARLNKLEGTNRPVASLANLLRLHRPMVIVDEAHNARASLSFDTLRRFDPSLILELTATPKTEPDRDGQNPPSNILFHVSAAELKAEEMIKLPIRLQTDTDWQRVIGQALDCQMALEEAAKAEHADTGEYIRPIILFGAQSASQTDPSRLTPDKVADFLTEDKRIPREQIAIHATGHNDLDKVDNIASPDCPIRYVITVQKLREGWDCPFAYVLCSVAELSSPTAVEQLLGRVMRMPGARRKSRDVLNRAYAFVASSDFQRSADALKDGLIEGSGFDKLEADELVKPHGQLQFDEERADYKHESDALPDTPQVTPAVISKAMDTLPASIRARVSFDAAKRTLAVTGPLSRDQRNLMHLAMGKIPGAAQAIDRLFIRSNRIQASEAPEGARMPFIVPGLGIRRGGTLELFSQDHFLALPWNLAECDPAPFIERFAIRDPSRTGEIDVTDEGQLAIRYSQQLQRQLSLAIHEPAWTLPRLVNWIDRQIPHADVTKPAARLFIQGALEGAMKAKGVTFDELARHKYEAKRLLGEVIDGLRRQRQDGQYAALFDTNAQEFETSADIGIVFDEPSYCYNEPYKGARKFNKHYTPVIGDLKPEGEEFKCAVYLDECAEVRYWIRNVDRKPNAFWLQLAKGKFYPDFVALLTDGRVMAVEYKGAQLANDPGTLEKRKIGTLWAEASGGHCLFAMPTAGDFDEIRRVIGK